MGEECRAGMRLLAGAFLRGLWGGRDLRGARRGPSERVDSMIEGAGDSVRTSFIYTTT